MAPTAADAADLHQSDAAAAALLTPVIGPLLAPGGGANDEINPWIRPGKKSFDNLFGGAGGVTDFGGTSIGGWCWLDFWR